MESPGTRHRDVSAELAGRAAPGSFLDFVLACIVALASPYPAHHPAVIYPTLALLGMGGVLRYRLCANFERFYRRDPRVWRRTFGLATLSLSVIWGVFACLSVLLYGLQWTSFLVLLCTAGIASGAMASFSPDARLLRPYLLALLGPAMLAGLIQGSRESLAMAFVFACFLGYLLAQGRRLGADYWALVTKEAQLQERAAELEREVARRRQVERNLEEAIRTAEEASRLKSEFLANMSHEIRTPMNGIIGMTELALDTDLTPEQRNYLNAVKSSATALLTIINDILDFSKIEAGRLELEEIPFSLRDCVGECLKTVALRAHEKRLELACDIPSAVPDNLLGDPVRLRQVILNLVSNAIKFTERGEVIVRVRLEEDNERAAVLRFEVEDTGIGIPEDKLERIFEPFLQADGSTTRQYGGTGLGLSISSRLVSMMGGRIWVESQPGRGSIFYFTARFGLDTRPSKITPVAQTDLHGLPVLVVDDNATNRKILEDMLHALGMTPTSAASGKEALERLEREGPFALAVLDVQMPEMDGFALAERIRRDPRLGSPKLMLLTSAGQRGDGARCREMGLDAYLTKPITRSELEEAVRAVLGRRDGAGSSLVTRHSLREQRLRLKVLLAEDNPVNRTLAERLLQKRGHVVHSVGNGRLALEALERETFDAVLMDVQMPEMDGLTATQELRRREAGTGRRTPVIALTAHAMKGDRERCLAAGMDAYIAKPLHPEQLFATLERLVGEGRAASPAAEDGQETRPMDRSDAVPFDLNRALEHAAGDPELLREMVGLFLEEAPQRLAALRDALARADAAGLRAAAHSLKGGLATLGADAAAALARELEQAGAQGKLDQAAALLERLAQDFAALREALRRWQAGALAR